MRLSRLEQLKYELNKEIKGLEKSHSESPNNKLVSEMLLIKQKQFDNVSSRLANLRIKQNDL